MTQSKKRRHPSPDPSPFEIYWQKRLEEEKMKENEELKEITRQQKEEVGQLIATMTTGKEEQEKIQERHKQTEIDWDKKRVQMEQENETTEKKVKELQAAMEEMETTSKKNERNWKEQTEEGEKERERLIAQMEEMNRRHDDGKRELEENMTNLRQELAENNLEINDMRTRLEEKERALAAREKEHQEMGEVIDRMKTEMDVLKGKAREVDAHSEQVTMELMEALEKIRKLSEEKAQVVEEMDMTKDELSRLGIEVLAIRKEALDASLVAAEANRKMELAIKKSEQLEQKMSAEGNNLDSEETTQELEFLRKIVATKENEVEGLKRRVELALSPGALLEMVPPKKKEIPKRMYCDTDDICETFDQHETEDCLTEVGEEMGMDYFENADVTQENLVNLIDVASSVPTQTLNPLDTDMRKVSDVTKVEDSMTNSICEENGSNQPKEQNIEQWKCQRFQTRNNSTGIYYEDENGLGYVFSPPRIQDRETPRVQCLNCKIYYRICTNLTFFIRDPNKYHKETCQKINVSEEIKLRIAHRFTINRPIPWPAGDVIKDLSMKDLIFAELPDAYDHYSLYMISECVGFNTNRLSLRKRFILYFGISLNLQLRWNVHIHKKKFDRKAHGMIHIFTFYKDKMPAGMGISPQEAAQAVELLLWRLHDMPGLLPDASKDGSVSVSHRASLQITRSTFYKLLFFSVYVLFASSDCVTYDVCFQGPIYANYCPANNHTRHPLPLGPADSLLQQELAQKCPHLFAGGNDKLCCSGSQIKLLFAGMETPIQIFQRCPACFDNFWKNWCEYTCSPNQSDFVKNETCTAEKWFRFMGTRNPVLSVPTDIDYVYHNASSTASYMHVNTTRCDQAPRAGMSKCGRTYCPLVPIVQDFFPEDTGTQETCRLLGIGCTVYFLILAVFVFVTILVCVLVTYCFRGGNGSMDKLRRKASESDWGTLESVANWIPKQVEVNAGLFGEFLTRQSYLTTLFGVFLAVVCCSGLAFLSVIMNPVDMWAPPNSRTIQEKKYFDSHFGQFYRVQQIIMYPKKENRAGAVFEKEFFAEVFNVVNRVRNLTVHLPDNKKVTLGDICHQPMGPGYDCFIKSTTNYFMHNPAWLDVEFIPDSKPKEEEDVFDYYDSPNSVAVEQKTYIDHLHDCIGNPYTTQSSFNTTCLGTFGGPTFPYLVFGGETEDSKDFMNSSAVIISIPVT